MNRHTALVAAAAMLVAVPSTTSGQDKPAEAVADSVASFTRQLAESWTRLDPDAYLQWFSDDFVLYISGQRVPRIAFESVVRSTTGALRESTFDISDAAIQVLSPVAAVISFGLREVMVDTTGAVTDLRAAMTLVWQKQGARWRITLAHESLSPPPSSAGSGHEPDPP